MNTKTEFDNYIVRLKEKRSKNNYTYTDDDFIKYESYIRRCFENDLSPYKCLEFMYYERFETQTPAQRMMGFILDKFENKLSKNLNLSQELDSCFETVLEIEKQKMKEFYLTGVSKGRNTIFFNADEHFEKTYYKIFPDEDVVCQHEWARTTKNYKPAKKCLECGIIKQNDKN